MKRVLRLLFTVVALILGGTFIAYASGSGYVSGSTVVYRITDIPEGDPVAFCAYLLTNDAHIKCYGSTAQKAPQAKNGSSINKYNMTPSINKGTVSSKSALKTTASNGSVIKAAERVSFSYSYVGGTFTATISIENPSSALTGLAFVGRDGKGHYYPVGGGDGTIDISALVHQAARNAAGPGGNSSGPGGSNAGGGGTGSGGNTSGPGGSGAGGGGTGPGGNSSGPGGSGAGGGGTGSGGNSSGPGGSGAGGTGTGSGGNSSGPGGSGAGGTGTGTGGNSSGPGGSGAGGSGTGSGGNSSGAGNAGSGTGTTGTGQSGDDDTANDHSQDMIDIRDSISDITSPSKPSDHKANGNEGSKPPCVLRRIWG